MIEVKSYKEDVQELPFEESHGLVLHSEEELKQKILTVIQSKETIKIRYFNTDGMFCQKIYKRDETAVTNIKDDFSHNSSDWELFELGEKYCKGSNQHWFKLKYRPVAIFQNNSYCLLHGRWWNWLVSRIPVNSTIDEFFLLYNEIVDLQGDLDEMCAKHPDFKRECGSLTERLLKATNISKETYQFILRVSDITIERETDNLNPNTFDFVRCFISIPDKESMPNRISFIKSHKNEILKVVLQYIEKSKRYTKYGVPIQFLQIKSMTITRQSQIQCLFELKC